MPTEHAVGRGLRLEGVLRCGGQPTRAGAGGRRVEPITSQRTGHADPQVVAPVGDTAERGGVASSTVARRLSIISGFFAYPAGDVQRVRPPYPATWASRTLGGWPGSRQGGRITRSQPRDGPRRLPRTKAGRRSRGLPRPHQWMRGARPQRPATRAPRQEPDAVRRRSPPQRVAQRDLPTRARTPPQRRPRERLPSLARRGLDTNGSIFALWRTATLVRALCRRAVHGTRDVLGRSEAARRRPRDCANIGDVMPAHAHRLARTSHVAVRSFPVRSVSRPLPTARLDRVPFGCIWGDCRGWRCLRPSWPARLGPARRDRLVHVSGPPRWPHAGTEPRARCCRLQRGPSRAWSFQAVLALSVGGSRCSSGSRCPPRSG